MSIGWKLFFGAVLIGLLVILVIFINTKVHNFSMGFDSKRELAQRIYDKLGNTPTRNLRYDEFIRKYPEGDNALYSDIKKLDVIDVEGLMKVL